MVVRTFWVWRRGEGSPECAAARDQDSVELHPEGWERAKQQVRDAYGLTLIAEREIGVLVTREDVLSHFGRSAPINGGAQQ